MKLSPQDVESLKDNNNDIWNAFSYENNGSGIDIVYEMDQS